MSDQSAEQVEDVGIDESILKHNLHGGWGDGWDDEWAVNIEKYIYEYQSMSISTVNIINDRWSYITQYLHDVWGASLDSAWIRELDPALVRELEPELVRELEHYTTCIKNGV